jgi:hypothetical protein
MVLLISYDLNGHERPNAYRAVARAIEGASEDFRRPLYSQWLVVTKASPTAWREYLTQYMDADDHLFICEVVRGRDGWLPGEVWDWLTANGAAYY